MNREPRSRHGWLATDEITGIERDVAQCLDEHRDQLERLAERLFEEETLEASEIGSLLGIDRKSTSG